MLRAQGTLVIALTLAAACNAGKPSASMTAEPTQAVAPAALPSGAVTPESVPPSGALHLGAPITADSETVALSDITKNGKSFENRVVTTSGTVFAVCQSMGCWMEIKDDKTEAHVKLAGHSFFVPKTSAGHHARVQAKVLKTNPDDECAQEAAQQTGKPVAKLELEAMGVEID